MPLELAARFGMIVHAPEIISAGHGRHGAVERENFQAVAGEIEIVNNFGAQERNDVGENRKFEAGNDFFGYRSATQNVAALEHQDFFAGAGKIGRVDKAIVATADYNDIVTLRHGDFLR